MVASVFMKNTIFRSCLRYGNRLRVESDLRIVQRSWYKSINVPVTIMVVYYFCFFFFGEGDIFSYYKKEFTKAYFSPSQKMGSARAYFPRREKRPARKITGNTLSKSKERKTKIKNLFWVEIRGSRSNDNVRRIEGDFRDYYITSPIHLGNIRGARV